MLPALIFFGVAGARAALEDEVRAYEARDAANPPPEGAILFVGSSSINGWPNLPSWFPGRSVLNRGFGGSQMSDLLDYFERLVVPYDPPLMVVYEGDNDLVGSKTVAQVFADYRTFAARVEQRLPEAEVVFIAVKPSPSRASSFPKFLEFNALLKDFCEDKPHFRFVDVYDPMLDAEGRPRPELFQSDMLHMVAAGYELWTSLIEPVLDEAPFLVSRHVLVDFGAAATSTGSGPLPDDPINAWNNVPAEIGVSPTGQLAALVATDGTVTPFGLSIVSPFAGVNEAGVTTTALYPARASGDSLYGHTEEFVGQSDVFPSFKLTGLDRGASYHFTFFASRTAATDNRETIYTVAGDTTLTATLDASNNVGRLATVADVVPDETGAITISLSPGPANDNANHFTYLGVMNMEERPPPAPVALVQEPADVTAEVGWPATFAVGVTGAPPLTVQWFAGDEAIPDATELTYTIPETTPEMNGRLFSVKVSNARSEVTSRQALLQVVPDTTPPAPQTATTADGVDVEIVFNEALDPASVAALESYAVHGGLVPVVAAVLQPDGRTLVLTLAHRVGGEVTARLAPVRDLAGNSLAADTTVVFQTPGRQPRTFLFDFGASGRRTTLGDTEGNDPLYSWNNITSVGSSNTGRLEGLVAADGEPTTAGLVMLNRFNGANENGATTDAPFPSNATRDSLFGNTETFSGQSNIFPKFKLIGLDPSLRYELTFYASRTGVSDNRETGYTVTGGTSGFTALNAAGNLTTTATVADIPPTAEGEITISLAPTENNNNANHFTYLGVLRVRSSEPLALATPHFLAGSTLVLDWTGEGILEWSTDLSEPSWTPVDPAPVPPWFEDVSNVPQKFFRLRPAP